MVEYIFSLVIYGLISLILIGIGVSQIKSKEPVGFYTHEQAPHKQDIVDIESWNMRHGIMWIGYGVAMIGVHLVCMFIADAILFSILLLGVTIVPLPLMMWYHGYLKKKYYR